MLLILFQLTNYHFILGTIWIAGRTREFNQNNFNKAITKLTQLGVPDQEWTMNYSRDC